MILPIHRRPTDCLYYYKDCREVTLLDAHAAGGPACENEHQQRFRPLGFKSSFPRESGGREDSLERVTGNVSSERRAQEQDGLGGLLCGSRAVERDMRVRFRLVGVGLLAAGGDSEGDLYRSGNNERMNGRVSQGRELEGKQSGKGRRDVLWPLTTIDSPSSLAWVRRVRMCLQRGWSSV